MPEESYSEQHIVNVSVAEYVCRQPKLSTAHGTLEEVYAFLRGCDAMMIHRSPLKVRPPTPQDALNWIYEENRKLGKGLDLARLRNHFGSDEATLASLLKGIQALRPIDDPI